MQYYICERVQQYPIGELRFYSPQFLQLLVTVDTDSMAMEELIKSLCSKDAHFALITFWHLQAMLQDLSAEPESIGFQTCKRLINELQYDYFNYSTNTRTITSPTTSSTGAAKAELGNKFHPNIAPAIVLATSLMSGLFLPESVEKVEPIVKIQGKQIKAMVFEVVKDVKKSLTENLTKKNTLSNALLGSSNRRPKNYFKDVDVKPRPNSMSLTRHSSSPIGQNVGTDSQELKTRKSDDVEFYHGTGKNGNSELHNNDNNNSSSNNNSTKNKTFHSGSSNSGNNSMTLLHRLDLNDDIRTHSMPDLHSYTPISPHVGTFDIDSTNGGYSSDGTNSVRNSQDGMDILSSSDSLIQPIQNKLKFQKQIALTNEQQIKLLKANYFKNETQFVIALQNISIRLSKVPKEARLSTLKAELSVLNSDLPCEIDIPMLLPKSKRGTLHKICRIAVNESAVLNSAERVPYLILIEYLSDNTDFNPLNPHNKKILNNIEESGDIGTSKNNKRYKFDLAYKAGKHRNVSDSKISDDNSHGDFLTNESNDLNENKNENEDEDEKLPELDLADVNIVKLNNKLQSSDSLISNSEKSSSIPYPTTAMEHEQIAGQLRIASIMLQQLQSSNSPIPVDQAMELKERIIESMNIKQKELAFASNKISEPAGERKLKNDMKVAGLSYLGEDWQSKRERIKKESPFGHLENWDLFSMIAKTGDDLAQEAFACQLIQLMANIWYQDKVKVWVKRMKILVTSVSTGLVETITNAVSVHSIKKALEQHKLDKGEIPVGITLKDHFTLMFGDEKCEKYQRAQENFAKSLAAYSVICYILQIKDRHNGNIMFDSEGHIVHIDFGFLLSNSPGSIGFEAAPFKLTQEYVDILGGQNSYYFKYFIELTKQAFKSLRNNADVIIDMVELMQKDSPLPCFLLGDQTSVKLRQRFELSMSDQEVENFIEVLINKSLNSAYTKLYDQFQLMTQGIYI
ncbi:1-phosphatidylinositol 4-kinase [Martiniozyma asiatica (nom. inval.)]|nr:1-phosphatidylinositol 4-kinase [Martiniozyma asiatica]